MHSAGLRAGYALGEYRCVCDKGYHKVCDNLNGVLRNMSAQQLVAGRRAGGWTQMRAAAILRVSQSYLSMLESGERRLTPALAGRARKIYRLAATVLELPEVATPVVGRKDLVGDLAGLGYPGFAHVASPRKCNPAEVVIAALMQQDLDLRVVEALPWILLQYADLDWDWTVKRAKLNDLQNRLGYVTQLARRFAEAHQEYQSKGRALAGYEAVLVRSRLQKEDTLCRDSMTGPEREWVRKIRPAEAAHWNLLTTLTPGQLRYAA